MGKKLHSREQFSCGIHRQVPAVVGVPVQDWFCHSHDAKAVKRNFNDNKMKGDVVFCFWKGLCREVGKGFPLLAVSLFLFACASCGDRDEQDKPMEFHVEHVGRKMQSACVDSIRTLVVTVPMNVPIAHVTDMDVAGGRCFVLDVLNRVFCVDTVQGRVIQSGISLGHAGNEMLSPACLTADDEYVYVYDSMKSQIFVLTHNLQLHHTLDVECDFGTFRKVKGGFACLSLGKEQNFHFLRDDGVVTYSRKLSDIYPGTIFGDHPIQLGGDGSVYVKAVYSNTIYRWDGKELSVAYKFDFGNEGVDETGKETGGQIMKSKRKFLIDYYVTRSHVLASYYGTREGDDRDAVMQCLANVSTHQCVTGWTGYVDGVVIVPSVQHGKYSYAVAFSDDFSPCKDKPAPNSVLVIRYEFPS